MRYRDINKKMCVCKKYVCIDRLIERETYGFGEISVSNCAVGSEMGRMWIERERDGKENVYLCSLN